MNPVATTIFKPSGILFICSMNLFMTGYNGMQSGTILYFFKSNSNVIARIPYDDYLLSTFYTSIHPGDGFLSRTGNPDAV